MGKENIMGLLRWTLKDLVKIEFNEGALEALKWKDFGNGLFMSRLARRGKSELVLYRVQADADSTAFLKHEHIGGEIYLVLKGEISDECGVYREGDMIYLDPKSVHTPRGIGETVVLVLWPAGVRVVD